MILDDGCAWNGCVYRSLSQVAKAITGTNWNGHRFFGLKAVRTGSNKKRNVTPRPDLLLDIGVSPTLAGFDPAMPDDVTYVIGSDRFIGNEVAVTVGRTHPDGDLRQSGNRFDPPKDLWRPEGPLIDDDRRVAHIVRFCRGDAREHDVAESFLVVAGEKARKISDPS